MAASQPKAIALTPEQPLFVSLRERLAATHQDAQAAWVAKTTSGLHELMKALGGGLRAIEVDIGAVANEEDSLALRGRLAELLRSAANAIAPRVG